MKKVCWVTADCFVDCDIQIIQNLSKYYKITWYIIFSCKKNRFNEEIKECFNDYPNVYVKFKYHKYRQRDIRNIIEYNAIGKELVEENANLYYLNYPPRLFYYFLWRKLNKNKTIQTAHQGEVHDGFKYPLLEIITRRSIYQSAKYVNMFSFSEARKYSKYYTNSTIFTILLGLKNFGKPNTIPSTNDCVFLSFGNINYGKHIDLLIDAACNIHEQGYRGFKVLIKGFCENWNFYKERIRYPEIFETDIRLIANEEIPNLFTYANFLVQPYRIVTQSGPLKIAFNYNTPVIVSNLSGFTDEVVEKVNGFIFKSEDVKDLEHVLIKAINLHKDKAEYTKLIKTMENYTEKIYSSKAICEQYVKMIENVIE